MACCACNSVFAIVELFEHKAVFSTIFSSFNFFNKVFVISFHPTVWWLVNSWARRWIIWFYFQSVVCKSEFMKYLVFLASHLQVFCNFSDFLLSQQVLCMQPDQPKFFVKLDRDRASHHFKNTAHRICHCVWLASRDLKLIWDLMCSPIPHLFDLHKVSDHCFEGLFVKAFPEDSFFNFWR